MSNRRHRTASFVAMWVLPLAIVGAFANNLRAQLVAGQRTESVNKPAIAAPTSWIPFRARVLVTHPDARAIQGRFFRGSDGSDRLETGPFLDDIRVVAIRNTQERLIFLFQHKLNTWTRIPWEPPLKGSPPRFQQEANWSVHPFRLALRKGESGSVSSPTGFRAYAVRTVSGIVTLKVPELNFFDAIRQRPDGRYEAYSEVEVGEQNLNLFYPPPDAIIVDRQERQPTQVELGNEGTAKVASQAGHKAGQHQ